MLYSYSLTRRHVEFHSRMLYRCGTNQISGTPNLAYTGSADMPWLLVLRTPGRRCLHRDNVWVHTGLSTQRNRAKLTTNHTIIITLTLECYYFRRAFFLDFDRQPPLVVSLPKRTTIDGQDMQRKRKLHTPRSSLDTPPLLVRRRLSFRAHGGKIRGSGHARSSVCCWRILSKVCPDATALLAK